MMIDARRRTNCILLPISFKLDFRPCWPIHPSVMSRVDSVQCVHDKKTV
jgi:hypothetical protein